MKNFTNLLIIAALVGCSFGFSQAQGIRFEEEWENAIEKATTENKPIFVDVYATWCGPCKQMEKLVFSRNDVGERFNQSFIAVKINGEEPLGRELMAEYGITAFPTYLFLTPTKNLLHKIVGAMPPEKLINEATAAISMARTFKPLGELEKAYNEGNREPRLLADLIERKQMQTGRQPLLLEELLKATPRSEYQTERVVKAIAQNVTSVDSEAFGVLVASLDRFQSMTFTQQKAVTDGIATAKKLTFKRIIETNDKVLFQKLLEAIRQTAYSAEGALAEEMQFRFDFAKITQDFVEFRELALPQANFLMNKTPAELAQESEEAINNFKNEVQARNLNENSGQIQLMLKHLERGAEKSTSYQLNDLAWGFVRMAKSNEDLEMALAWAKHAIELEESPANLDTYAHLQFRLGNKKEAIKTIKKAIKLAKQQGTKTESLKESYEFFKK